MTRDISTRWYKAPEVLFGSLFYTHKVDIWAAGCTIFELHNNRPLFNGSCDIEQLGKIFHVLGTINLKDWP